MNSFNEKVVLYDGDCGFCNRVVQVVIKNEKNKGIKFTSLNSQFSSELFAELNVQNPDKSTFYFFDGKKMFQRSTAAIELSRELKFPLSLLRMTRFVPIVIRDGVYNFIAKRRRRLSKGYCFIPSGDIKARFLD